MFTFAKRLVLICALAATSSAAMALEPCDVKTLDDANVQTINSWQNAVTKYIAKPTWTELRISGGASSRKNIPADLMSIILKIENQKMGSLHCIVDCQIYVEKIRVKDVKNLLDGVLRQNSDVVNACNRSKQEQAVQRQNFEKAQAALKIQAAQKEASDRALAQRQAEEQKLKNIELNKNNRPQVPAIIGDWYKAATNKILRITVDPSKTFLSILNCDPSIYWNSGAAVCVPANSQGLELERYHYNQKINGFCFGNLPKTPEKDLTDKQREDFLNNYCDDSFQVSVSDANILLFEKESLTKTEMAEKDRVYSHYGRIGSKNIPPEIKQAFPTTAAAVQAKVKQIVGDWSPIEYKKTDSKDTSTSDYAGQIREYSLPGIIEVQWCDKNIWLASDGRVCEKKTDLRRFYFEPLFNGFCYLEDKDHKNCQYGIKFRNGQIVEINDPIGRNQEKDKEAESGKLDGVYVKQN